MLALLLALQGMVSPQTTDSLPQVTLTEALQRAAQLDPNYVAALGQVDNAVWARRNAFAVFVLPSITVGTTLQWQNPPGFSVVPLRKLVAAQLTASYDVFTGGQKIAELSRSAAGLDSAHAGELAARFNTAMQTESTYYAVLAGAELDRVASERLRRAREQLGIARARVVSGAAVSTDSLNLRLEMTRAQVLQLVQQSVVRVARLQLGRRVGVAGPVDAAPLDTTQMPELPLSLADAISQAAVQGPQYRIAAARERAASAIFRGALGAYLPRATLTFSAFAADTMFYPNAFKQTSFVLGVSLPIWNNGQRELALSRARVNRDVARAFREDMDRAVQRDVTAAYDRYVTARASAELAVEGLTVARESFRVQQTRYSSGATTILDLLDAEVNLSQAEADLVVARYGTRLALAGLESILGKRLFSGKGNP
ncbi:MAG TPA: TolC family protein [Gemmatimonadales bacterium]|jgi:outer membrane protein TolC|nr:TolC family protein [Gemmatimonadales bacterium]